jgi:hypothetical protein
MVRLGLFHRRSGLTHWFEMEGVDNPIRLEWDMREAIGGAVQAVSMYLDVPPMAVMTEQNEFMIIAEQVKES